MGRGMAQARRVDADRCPTRGWDDVTGQWRMARVRRARPLPSLFLFFPFMTSGLFLIPMSLLRLHDRLLYVYLPAISQHQSTNWRQD